MGPQVAFGTLAMVSLGCTICRGCQLDTARRHSHPDREVEQAESTAEKFTPPGANAAESCARFFEAMGEEVKRGRLARVRPRQTWSAVTTSRAISHGRIDSRADHPARGVPRLDRSTSLSRRRRWSRLAPKQGGPREASPDGAQQASAEIAQIADKVFDGSCVSVEFPAAPMRTTGARHRASGAIARARIYDARLRAPTRELAQRSTVERGGQGSAAGAPHRSARAIAPESSVPSTVVRIGARGNSTPRRSRRRPCRRSGDLRRGLLGAIRKASRDNPASARASPSASSSTGGRSARGRGLLERGDQRREVDPVWCEICSSRS